MSSENQSRQTWDMYLGNITSLTITDKCVQYTSTLMLLQRKLLRFFMTLSYHKDGKV